MNVKDPSDATRLYVKEEIAEATRLLLEAEDRFTREISAPFAQTLKEMDGRVSKLEASHNQAIGAGAQRKSSMVMMGLVLGVLQIASAVIIALLMK